MDRNLCAHWLGKLGNLNVARTRQRGIAPHKPLMLLTVIDLIESGDIPDGWVKFDVRLVSRFRDYWELVLERQRNQPDIPMPFHALGSDRDQVWSRFTAAGEPSAAKATTRLCSLDPDLFACLQDSDFRSKVRTALVTIYFTPAEQVMLCARLGLPVPRSAEIRALREQAAEYKARQKKGRDSRFKSDVLGGYYFTCALTGYRLDTETTSIVQAAHIHQHAQSGNDDPRNGLALTPDAHWMFDAGLWTVVPKGDDLFVHVALGRFAESSPHGRLLSSFHNQPLCFHALSRLRPDPKHFEWHRKECLR
ncbi:HNH endonuclease [Haloferula chungangensis]|uniref:HNH endonuclease n=1 Tax=Haloferula chungangensis TaxID=1048331 RepID=A0ABW2L1E0_9BACT